MKVDEQHFEVEKQKPTFFDLLIEQVHGLEIYKQPINSDI